jgi:hypothetical protein
MEYELAEKLKEEGFKQEGEGEYEEDFYVCDHHQGTGGYEECCECDGERLCSQNPNSCECEEVYIPTLKELVDVCIEEYGEDKLKEKLAELWLERKKI